MAKTEKTEDQTQEQEQTEAPVVEQEAPKEKMITVRLPIIPGVEKQEAVFVSVNDREWVVPRGIDMELPECAVEVLRHSEDMQIEAIRYQFEKNQQ